MYGGFGNPLGMQQQPAQQFGFGNPLGLPTGQQPNLGFTGGTPMSAPQAPMASQPTQGVTPRPQPPQPMASQPTQAPMGPQTMPFTTAVPANNINQTMGLSAVSDVANAAAAPQESGQIANTDMSAYMNPYTQQVSDVVMQDLQRQNQILGNQMDASAMQAGAFGGSRHGVANAETNRAFLDQVARSSAGLNQNAYNTALQSAQFDIGNRNQMSQFNSGLGMQNANLQGNLQNLGFGQQQQVNNNLMNQGNMLQANQQALINAAQGQFQGFAGSPQQSLATLLSAISGVPSPISTTEEYKPGLLDFASAAIPFF